MFTTKAEIKLAILAVYHAFAVEVNAAHAQESILSTGEIDTFDCQECERELLEEGFLAASMSEGKLCYGITDIGSFTYSQSKDCGILREGILNDFVASALRHFEYICSGKKYTAEIEEVDGGYHVTCSLKSDKKTFMETKMYFSDRDEAYNAYMNCKSKPEMINSGVLTLMSGKLNGLY